MVRRRAAITEGDTREKKTGSSLYSWQATIHIATRCRRITSGSTRSRRSFSHSWRMRSWSRTVGSGAGIFATVRGAAADGTLPRPIRTAPISASFINAVLCRVVRHSSRTRERPRLNPPADEATSHGRCPGQAPPDPSAGASSAAATSRRSASPPPCATHRAAPSWRWPAPRRTRRPTSRPATGRAAPTRTGATSCATRGSTRSTWRRRCACTPSRRWPRRKRASTCSPRSRWRSTPPPASG